MGDGGGATKLLDYAAAGGSLGSSVPSVFAQASAPITGTAATARSTANFGSSVGFDSRNSYAFVTGQPSASWVADVIAPPGIGVNNPVGAVLGQPDSVIFGAGALGGNYSGSGGVETYTSTLSFIVDMIAITDNLAIGFYQHTGTAGAGSVLTIDGFENNGLFHLNVSMQLNLDAAHTSFGFSLLFGDPPGCTSTETNVCSFGGFVGDLSNPEFFSCGRERFLLRAPV